MTCTLQKNKTAFEEAVRQQSKTIGLFYDDEQSKEEFWSTLEDMRDSILDHDGQFISLNVAGLQAETLSDWLHTAVKDARRETPLPFGLPVVFQYNPHMASPFINHAIHWQRLCDLLILDDEPERKTVLVLKNAEQSPPDTQHEIARLIRFHETHSIHRTFVFTLNRQASDQLIPELREVLGMDPSHEDETITILPVRAAG